MKKKESVDIGNMNTQISFNKETVEAFKEGKAIMEGRIETKVYNSAEELFKELEGEKDEEE